MLGVFGVQRSHNINDASIVFRLKTIVMSCTNVKQEAMTIKMVKWCDINTFIFRPVQFHCKELSLSNFMLSKHINVQAHSAFRAFSRLSNRFLSKFLTSSSMSTWTCRGNCWRNRCKIDKGNYWRMGPLQGVKLGFVMWSTCDEQILRLLRVQITYFAV